MNEDDVQARLQKLKKAPQPVKAAAMWAVILGCIVLLRFLGSAYDGHMAYGKAFFSGLLMFAMFWFNGMALYSRSRSGFVIVTLLAILPLWGALGSSIHLLVLTVEGALSASTPDTVQSIFGLIQFTATFILFYFLFSRVARDYVWKQAGKTSGKIDVVEDDGPMKAAAEDNTH